jgi:hypothetical protein
MRVTLEKDAHGRHSSTIYQLSVSQNIPDMGHHGGCPSALFDNMKQPTSVAVAKGILPMLTWKESAVIKARVAQ